MTNRLTGISRVLLAMYLVAMGVLLFSTFNNGSLLQVNVWGLPADKVEHFILFFPFVFLVYFSFLPCFKNRSMALFLLLIFLAGIAVGGLTELVQALLPARACDLYDFLTDTLSILVSFIILIIFVVKYESVNRA